MHFKRVELECMGAQHVVMWTILYKNFFQHEAAASTAEFKPSCSDANCGGKTVSFSLVQLCIGQNFCWPHLAFQWLRDWTLDLASDGDSFSFRTWNRMNCNGYVVVSVCVRRTRCNVNGSRRGRRWQTLWRMLGWNSAATFADIIQ